MKEIDKKICIAGTKSGVGKTTVTMAILAWLQKRMKVQPYKVGPDYIDPMFHSRITGNKSRNLDSFLMDDNTIRYLFEKNSRNKDIAVIEGVMGLFDGKEVGSDIGTTASVAKITKTRVLLVVDGGKAASSVAAVVKGFQTFDPDLTVAGVIVNYVGSKGHYDLLKEAIMHHTGIPAVGYILNDEAVTLPERHLGLVPAEELGDLEAVFERLEKLAESCFDMDKILEISGCPAAGADADVMDTLDLASGNDLLIKSVRVGYAYDQAFNFYYEDNMDYLRERGVELVPFSPLQDLTLPEKLDGLIFGGGFPEVFAKELEANNKMKESVKAALNAGIPYYAECGGLMYLCNELVDINGDVYEMVDWFEGKTEMTNRLQRFGYATLKIKKDSLFGNRGAVTHVHEFHHSIANIQNEKVFELTKSRKGTVTKRWECGYEKGNGIGAYAHIHYWANTDFADAFVNRCKAYKN